VLGTAAKIRNGASKTTSKIDDENRIEKQFLSSQAFHRTLDGHVREITEGEQFEPRILEYFVPVTQESYRLYPAQITMNSGTEQLNADQNQNENDHQNQSEQRTELDLAPSLNLAAAIARAKEKTKFLHTKDRGRKTSWQPNSSVD
jgi:hypothetical protein